MKYINLQFFKGGSSVKEVDKREPKSDQLKAMDDAFYNVFGGVMGRYGGVAMPYLQSYTPGGTSSSGTTATTGTTKQRVWDDNYGDHGKWVWKDVPTTTTTPTAASTGANKFIDLGDSGNYLSNALDTADAQAAQTNANINSLLASTPGLYESYVNLLNNGTNTGFENYISGSEDAISRAFAKNIGADVSSLANRGILNSSTGNKAIASQQAETANALASNRNTAYNNYAQNLLSGYNSGIDSIKTQTALLPSYYTDAFAPLTSAYNYWNQSTQNWLANDKDYVATSSGK